MVRARLERDRAFKGKYEKFKSMIKGDPVYMAIGTMIVLITANHLMGLFTDDANVADIGAVYLKIDALVFYAYVALFIHVSPLQGIKRPMYAPGLDYFDKLLPRGLSFMA
jgi:Na+-driven multidrug efflux pump